MQHGSWKALSTGDCLFQIFFFRFWIPTLPREYEYQTSPVFKWSRIWMQFEYWTSFQILPVFKCLVFRSLPFSEDMQSGLVWISNGWKAIVLQMVQILNGIWNQETQPFEIRTNSRHFVKKKHKIRTKMSRFWMVGTKAIAIAKAPPFEN